MTEQQSEFHDESLATVKMKSESAAHPSAEEEFDIIDDSRPRGEGFVQIGDVVRPMVQRLAEHLADKAVIEQPREVRLQRGKPRGRA